MKDAFESAQECAQRLGVTVRAVQKWAASGKLPGAERLGRSWLIPRGVVPTEKVDQAHENGSLGHVMPLLNSIYRPGNALDYIQAIPAEDFRDIAMGEYYYYRGEANLAVDRMEEYLDSDDPSLRYTAALVCTFANLSMGHIHLAQFALNTLRDQVSPELYESRDPRLHALAVLTATAAHVLLQVSIENIPPLIDQLRWLPEGLKQWGCYVLAHQAYLNGKYRDCLIVSQMGLALFAREHPVPQIYLHISAAMALVSLKRAEEAARHLEEAWHIALPDRFWHPFAEHHFLLKGMLESRIKPAYPKEFAELRAQTDVFSAGWRKIHKLEANAQIADNLTVTEFTVAMLYCHGWSVKEIAEHMMLSNRTVSNYVAVIYAKLCINGRNELAQYMMK